MTRFEYLRNNITQRQMAKYLSEITTCEKCECYDFCSNVFKSCEDAIYEYLSTEQN